MIFGNAKIWMYGTLLILGVVYMIKFIPTTDPHVQYQHDKCRLSSKMKSALINGFVQEKFIDKANHSYPTILISYNNRNKKFVFTNELSNFYEYVKVGDNLRKESNSLEVEISRNGELISKDLDYGCLEKFE